MTRHILFDFDGVLCDSRRACVREYETLRRSGFTSLPALGADDRLDVPFSVELRRSLLSFGLTEDESRRFFDAHSHAMAADAENLSPFPGVRALLFTLPEKSVSIVSSAYNVAISSVLRVGGSLPGSIAGLYGRDTGLPKSNKIHDALRSVGADLDDGVYVGDLYSDLLYARSVRLSCWLVTYGYHSAEFLHSRPYKAEKYFDSVAQMRNHVHSYLTCDQSGVRP